MAEGMNKLISDEDSTIISVQIVNGITDHITNGLYTHFWFTLNGVNMSAEEHGSCKYFILAPV